jgi:hypothetical protein
MDRFKATLVAGTRRPYTSWTFVELPDEVPASWGRAGPFAVRGTLAGVAFRGTVSRSRGVYRLTVTKALQQEAGVARGDRVEVALELDDEPRPVDVPPELEAVFADDPKVRALFDQMAPSHRRAWATYVADAKRPETRRRRASQAPAGIRARRWPR